MDCYAKPTFQHLRLPQIKTMNDANLPEGIENRIYLIRNQKVLLDSDLAGLYGVATKVLVQSVQRNQNRFPEDFCFQLSNQEVVTLRSQIVTSKKGCGGRRTNPYECFCYGLLFKLSWHRS